MSTTIFPPPNPADDDYIRRGDLLIWTNLFYSPPDRALKTGPFVPGDWAISVETVYKVPAANVRPVVRGHWIGTKEAEEMGDIMKEFTCSVCGCCEWDCTESESFNFCPNCGADMREES